MPEKKKIGELLLELGTIDKYQLKAALNRQERWGKKLGEILVEMGFISEDDLLKVLSKIFNMPSIKPDKFEISKAVLRLVPREVCSRLSVMPLAIRTINGKKRFVVAMSDPADFSALDELQFLTNLKVLPMVSSVNAIKGAITKYFMQPDTSVEKSEVSMISKISRPGEYMEIVRQGREEKIKMEEDAPPAVQEGHHRREDGAMAADKPAITPPEGESHGVDFSEELDKKLGDFDIGETDARPSPFADEEYEESTGVFKEGNPLNKLIAMLRRKTVISDEEMKVLLSVASKVKGQGLNDNRALKLLVELLKEKGMLTEKEKKILDES